MAKRLFDRTEHAHSSVTEVFHDLDDGKFAIEMVEKVDGLIEAAKAASDAPETKADGMRLEAVIPQSVVDQAMREGWFHDPAAWKRWANDPNNKAFRIEHGGKVKRL